MAKCRGKRAKVKSEQTEQIAYRFRGHPSAEVEQQLIRQIGCCRFLWNRMLADEAVNYAATKTHIIHPPSFYKQQSDLKWLNDCESTALCNVQLNLDAAFSAFFAKERRHPKFKKKGVCRDSFTSTLANRKSPNLRLNNNLLKLPKIKEEIKLTVHRPIKPGGILKSCTVAREKTGDWYFSLVFEYPKSEPPKIVVPPSKALHIGLDMSLPHLFVDSDGDCPAFTRPYRTTERKLAKEQRRLSKMKKNSNNYKKQRQKIAKLHAKTKHQRKDLLHKLSCQLVNTYHVVGIEDLDMAGMRKSLNYGKSVSDIGWGNFVRMLTYKAERTGCHIIKIDRWFPSSKACMVCGYVHKELLLNDRVYFCPCCGNVMDRDHQAAINIDREAMRIYRGKVFPLIA